MEFFRLFLIVVVLVGLCFAGIGIRIWIKGVFAETEVGHNKHMRAKGLMCAKEEELRQWKTDCDNPDSLSCGYCTPDSCGSTTCGTRL